MIGTEIVTKIQSRARVWADTGVSQGHRNDHDEPQLVLHARVSKALRQGGDGWRLTFPCIGRRGRKDMNIRVLNCPHVNGGEGRKKEK